MQNNLNVFTIYISVQQNQHMYSVYVQTIHSLCT